MKKTFKDLKPSRVMVMLGGTGGKRKRGGQRMRWLDGITLEGFKSLNVFFIVA